MTILDKIEGFDLKNLDFNPMFMGDIMHFEGAILSHYIDQRQKNYLLYIIGDDKSKKQSIWLLFSVSVTNLFEYLNNKITLYSLITLTKDRKGYLTWCDEKGYHKKYRIINIPDLPKNVLPEKNSYFDKDFGTSYKIPLMDSLKRAIQLKKNSQIVIKNSGSINSYPDYVYHSFNNDINVLKLRVISHLLEPSIHSHIQGSAQRISQLIEIANHIDQDPFGNVYSNLMKNASEFLKINTKGKSDSEQYNDVVYNLTKLIGESIINSATSTKRSRLNIVVYVNFINLVDSNNFNINYYDISENKKFKKMKEELSL